MVKYYPPVANIAKLAKEYKGIVVNFAEAQRLQDVEEKKRRGKGAPTKAKDKGLWGVFRASCLVDIIRRAESQDSQETVVGRTTNATYIYLSIRLHYQYCIILPRCMHLTISSLDPNLGS